MKRLVFVCCWVSFCSHADAEPDPVQAAKDARIVETLLRLPGVDVNANDKLKSAVLRYLETKKETPRYLELVKRFKLRDASGELLRLAVTQSDSTLGVDAATLLLEFDLGETLNKTIAGPDEKAAVNAVKVLGLVGSEGSNELLRPLIDGSQRRAVRVAAASALGRNVNGQRMLLAFVTSNRLPKELNFTVANALYGSADPAIREEVKKHLKLPASAGSKPLPPLSDLVTREGSVDQGKTLFHSEKIACAKCHKVRGQGKEVGPDLSEIGSKLSREAMFVAILDPSAGISHNYETYTIALDSGNVLSGIIISDTDDSLTLKTKDAIVKTVDKEEIEFMKKSGVSLMPADLQKNMTAQDLVDVVQFLSTLKKVSGE